MAVQPDALAEAAPTAVDAAQVAVVIRHATFRELTAVSKVLKNAFWDEDAIGRFMHPRREQFPGDVERYWKQRLRGSFVDWHHDLLVAVEESSGDVLGVAEWARFGPGAEAIKGKGWRWTLRKTICFFLFFILSLIVFFCFVE
jgi:hypothetical protein